MRLTNLDSSMLLPEFGSKAEWMCKEFDSFIRPNALRSRCLTAPLDKEALEQCTEQELEQYFDSFGLADYYPDVSKERKIYMLLTQQNFWTRLSTKTALKALVQYIFDEVEIELEIQDNLAFDKQGQLVDPDALDTFYIEVIPKDGVLPENAMQRVVDNVYKFVRNTQCIKGIIYRYESEIIAYSSMATHNSYSVEHFI